LPSAAERNDIPSGASVGSDLPERSALLPSIRYGEVPAGFRQIIPADGASPPALIEGKTYDVFTPTYNANGGGVRFVIKGEFTREMKYLQRNNPLLLIF